MEMSEGKEKELMRRAPFGPEFLSLFKVGSVGPQAASTTVISPFCGRGCIMGGDAGMIFSLVTTRGLMLTGQGGLMFTMLFNDS